MKKVLAASMSVLLLLTGIPNQVLAEEWNTIEATTMDGMEALEETEAGSSLEQEYGDEIGIQNKDVPVKTYEYDFSDVLIQEGGYLPEEEDELVCSDTVDTTTVKDQIIGALELMADDIVIQKDTLTAEEVFRLYVAVLNENPRFFYVDSHVTGEESENTLTIHVNYEANATQNNAAYEKAVSQCLQGVSSSWTEMEKVLYLNDYLCTYCAYDTRYYTGTIPRESYTAYGVMVNRIAVCQGYAEALVDLCKRVGVDCQMVTSRQLNHAWNMVKLNGKYYMFDTTWNDPLDDRLGRARHFYFLKSAQWFQSGTGEHQASDYTITNSWKEQWANDTSMDSFFWDKYDSSFEYINGKWYGISSNGVSAYQTNGITWKQTETIYTSNGQWLYYQNGSTNGSFYPGIYITLDQKNQKLYFNGARDIFQYDPSTKQVKKYHSIGNDKAFCIYGIQIEGNVIQYVGCENLASSGKKVIYTDCTITGETPVHTHSFTQKVVSREYLKADATCLKDATYYYACANNCGTKGQNTYTVENTKLGHNYTIFAPFEWSISGDKVSANVVVSCSRSGCLSTDQDHSKKIACRVTSEVYREPTTKQKGMTRYTAYAYSGNASKTEIKDIENIPCIVEETKESKEETKESKAETKESAKQETKESKAETKESAKQETKESKAETKESTKQETKESKAETKESAKQETKESKAETKESAKQETKESKAETKETSQKTSVTILFVDDLGTHKTYSATYTGNSIKPKLAVSCDQEDLTLNQDYTVTYADNIQVGEARVTIKGKGNYAGTYQTSFSIVQADIKNLTVNYVKEQKEIAQNRDLKILNSVVHGKRTCVKGRDYEVTYRVKNGGVLENTKNLKPGNYEMVIEGKGSYTGRTAYPFIILANTTKFMSKATVKLSSNKAKIGETPAVQMIQIGGIKYTQDGSNKIADYFQIEKIQNNPVGKQELRITAKSAAIAYGSKSVFYTVDPLKLQRSQFEVVSQEQFVYTGQQIEPRVTSTLDQQDYTITYTNNIKAGKGNIVITGRRNYSGKLTYTFTIQKATITDTNCRVEPKQVPYSKAGAKPELTVWCNNQQLVSGTDYTITGITKNKTVGTAYCNLQGKGNYTGMKKAIPYQIVKAQITKEMITITDMTYSPKKKVYQPTIVVKGVGGNLVKNKDYTISYPNGNEVLLDEIEKNGHKEIKVEITGTGNNYKDKVTVSFIVSRKKASSLKTTVDQMTYTKGKPVVVKKENIKVYDGRNEIKDFEILESTYKNNSKAGKKATVVIRVKGYAGTKTVTFTILPKSFG